MATSPSLFNQIFYFLKDVTEMWPIYNVVFISAIQQSVSHTSPHINIYIYIYIYIYVIYISFSVFFPIMVYDRILSTVFCATQLDLVVKSSTCLTPHFYYCIHLWRLSQSPLLCSHAHHIYMWSQSPAITSLILALDDCMFCLHSSI